MAKSKKKRQFQEVFKDVLNYRERSIEGWKESRGYAERCAEYIRHKHFTDEEIQKAEDNTKPLLRYNILLSKLTTLLGNEINNRRVIKIIPQGYTEEKVVRILDDNFQSIYEKESLDDKYVKLLADALIHPTGGWIRRYIELDDSGYLNFKYKLIDSFFVHPDPEFREMDLSDCSFVVIDDWLSLDEIKMRFGASQVFDTEERQRTWSTTETLINSIAEKSQDEQTDYAKNGKYLVYQLEKKVATRAYVCAVEGVEDYLKLTADEVDQYRKEGANIDLVTETMVNRVQVTTIAPFFKDIVLHDREYPIPTENLSVFSCFSYDFNSAKAKTPSLIYVLLDIQDRINKGMSQQVDFVTQALGMPWHVDAREKEAIEQLKKVGNQPGKVITYKNPNNKAEKQPTPQVPPDILNNVLSDVGFIDDISNINKAMEGFSERSGETGVLFDSKVKQALSATNNFFENLVKTMKRIKEDYLELVPHVYFEDDRILEISPQEMGAKDQLNYEMVNVRYEGNIENDVRNISARVALDDVYNTPNRLEKTFNENIALANIMISAGAQYQDIPWDLIIKRSTIRDKEIWEERILASQQRIAEQMANEQANADMERLVNTAQAITPPVPPQSSGGNQ